MKRILSSIILLLFCAILAVPVLATAPGNGTKVQPARATWNTGYFQEVLVRKGLTELGYIVKKPKELQNPIFYQALALGDIDYWANGWFPMHTEHIPKNSADKIEVVGYVVKAGGLQGYLVSKKEVDKFNIKSLDDFKRPEIKKAFDKNGDGKADLVACPAGWGCETTIEYHLDTYEMRDHINSIKAGYTASMADTLARYKNGEPIFFFTWAPNWTIFKFKPGTDVMWIDVPEIRPREVEMSAVDRMTVAGVEGAVNDPAKLGFVAADIQIVANKEFLNNNPAARKFFELFTLPLSDINEQNTKMQDGEKSTKDIDRHADEWIAKNKKTWDRWVNAAKASAQ